MGIIEDKWRDILQTIRVDFNLSDTINLSYNLSIFLNVMDVLTFLKL